jgi:hypothetical protein
MTATMVTDPITDTAKRLTEFAADVSQLANERRDLELRNLVDQVHSDLLRIEEED